LTDTNHAMDQSHKVNAMSLCASSGDEKEAGRGRREERGERREEREELDASRNLAVSVRQ